MKIDEVLAYIKVTSVFTYSGITIRIEYSQLNQEFFKTKK
jgi:hypothetical protein